MSAVKPILQAKGLLKRYGTVVAMSGADFELYPGEILGVIGDNGAGKSTLIKALSGAVIPDHGTIELNGKKIEINNPRDARSHNIETIYQTLALSDNLDAASNLFLGRELMTPYGFVDDAKMEAETRNNLGRLNPNFKKFSVPVSALSGGQRQPVAIPRAVYFDARILIMDEPTAALGPQETQMVAELIQELKAQGLGIFLIEHDIHNVMKLCDRAAGDEKRPAGWHGECERSDRRRYPWHDHHGQATSQGCLKPLHERLQPPFCQERRLLSR